MPKKENAILLISCPDRRGLIAGVTDFIYKNNGNIEHSDQHVDTEAGIFFMRIEWSLKGFNILKKDIHRIFNAVGEKFNMNWHLHFTGDRPKIAVFVSKQLHCLYDLLFHHREGSFNADISLIVSNHPEAKDVAASFGVDFVKIPITAENKIKQEIKQLKELSKRGVELIILARYMQILTRQFVSAYPYKIINIHHSFLPAFKGAKPYEQAYSRGVKIIGATSHYVTEELDTGPIIEQNIIRVSHRDTVEDLRRKGEDIEKIVLSRTVHWHLCRKILVYDVNGKAKTVVFE